MTPMNEWTDSHETLATEADPAGPVEPGVVDRAWARVTAELHAPAPRRRSRKAVAVGAAVAVVVGLAGTAAAGVLSSRTGEYVDREDWQAGGPGEQLNPWGSDFRDVVAEESADIPFPSDFTRETSLDFWESDLRRGTTPDEPVLVSTSAITGFVANDAICSWANEWARATRAGDAVAVDEASDVLRSAATWDVVVTLQSLEHERFDWLRGVERAAEGTSVRAMGSALVTSVFCQPALVPDLPGAIPDADW